MSIHRPGRKPWRTTWNARVFPGYATLFSGVAIPSKDPSWFFLYLLLFSAEMKYHECADCCRLWGAYGEATMAHIGLQGRLRVATLAYDGERFQLLARQVEAAQEKRSGLRQAIHRH